MDAEHAFRQWGSAFATWMVNVRWRARLTDILNGFRAGFRDRLLSVHGAAFGLQPLLLQSAAFRPHNRSEDIERLYLVGAGTHPGAGVPGVLSSARVLDTVVPHASELHA